MFAGLLLDINRQILHLLTTYDGQFNFFFYLVTAPCLGSSAHRSPDKNAAVSPGGWRSSSVLRFLASRAGRWRSRWRRSLVATCRDSSAAPWPDRTVRLSPGSSAGQSPSSSLRLTLIFPAPWSPPPTAGRSRDSSSPSSAGTSPGSSAPPPPPSAGQCSRSNVSLSADLSTGAGNVQELHYPRHQHTLVHRLVSPCQQATLVKPLVNLQPGYHTSQAPLPALQSRHQVLQLKLAMIMELPYQQVVTTLPPLRFNPTMTTDLLHHLQYQQVVTTLLPLRFLPTMTTDLLHHPQYQQVVTTLLHLLFLPTMTTDLLHHLPYQQVVTTLLHPLSH